MSVKAKGGPVIILVGMILGGTVVFHPHCIQHAKLNEFDIEKSGVHIPTAETGRNE